MLIFEKFHKKKKIFLSFILFFFSILFNQYYGYIGILPIDSFLVFNSGYDFLNGKLPFIDYWTIKEPLLDAIQAIFFKIFGVSWFSYVLHASAINALISIFTFHTLYKLKLNINYCFIYSILVSTIAYTSAGTPYVDHHSSILSMISIFCFILALKTNLKVYWFLLPIFLVTAFLTKQAPAGHFILIVTFLTSIYFIFNFDIKKIMSAIFGLITILLIFLITLLISKISIVSFLEQYIFFPLSIGKSRLELFLFPLDFSRIFLRYKLIHLSTLILIIVSIKNILRDRKYLLNSEFLITLSLIGASYALIAHQLMTVNGIFIFFIIPILIGFSHIYYKNHFQNKKYIFNLMLLFAFLSTAHYGHKYIHKRDFMDLSNAKRSDFISAEIISNKLNGLRWISCLYPENPKKEITQLQEAINIIKDDKRNKSIITDYQFISVILSNYDFSPTQVWFINHVSSYDKGSDYFKQYKNLLIKKFQNNKIKVAYVVKPLWGGDNVFENSINKNCFQKTEVTKILDSYLFQECNDLKY